MELNKSEHFAAFLARKNINAEAFNLAEPLIFEKWKELFLQLHEESFVMMQKFHLNPIRRRFPLISHASVSRPEPGISG